MSPFEQAVMGMLASQRRPDALLADFPAHQRSDVAGASGQVQHSVAQPDAAVGHEVALPGAVDAERHQVVHQVVISGHRREYIVYEPGLFRYRNVPVAEMSGFFVLLVHDFRRICG